MVKALKAEVGQVERGLPGDRPRPRRRGHRLASAGSGRHRAGAGPPRRVPRDHRAGESRKPSPTHARIDMDLVDAQQARRVLDRLVGYNLSPLLWAKVRGRLSAGRVQSAALRLVVDREREIEGFQAREYWTIDADFLQPEQAACLPGPPGSGSTEIRRSWPIAAAGAAGRWTTCARAGYRGDRRQARRAVSAAPRRRSPPARCSRRPPAGWGSPPARPWRSRSSSTKGSNSGGEETVGLITYMRTDSTQVSARPRKRRASVSCRTATAGLLPDEPPIYRTRSRGAQEAHEAIRPTSVRRTPGRSGERPDAPIRPRLYRVGLEALRRLADETGRVRHAHHRGRPERRRRTPICCGFAASSLRFAGFLAVYEDLPAENGDAPKGRCRKRGLAQLLRAGRRGSGWTCWSSVPEQHFTQPPARLQRGDAGQGAGGVRHRSPVDLRPDPEYAAGAGLRPPHQETAWCRPRSA